MPLVSDDMGDIPPAYHESGSEPLLESGEVSVEIDKFSICGFVGVMFIILALIDQSSSGFLPSILPNNVLGNLKHDRFRIGPKIILINRGNSDEVADTREASERFKDPNNNT